MDCIEIANFDHAEEYLAANGRKLSEFDDQLGTNNAFVFKLASGKIVLVPGSLDKAQSCLIFQSIDCFNEAISNDHFPIENYNKSIEEYDVDGVRAIDLKIQDYLSYLAEVYMIKNPSLTRESIQDIYARVLKNKSRKTYDVVALGAIMGELLRVERNGKWLLRKWYGTYNPYYSPQILIDGDKVASVYGVLYSMIESRIQDSNKFFVRPGYGSKQTMELAGVVFKTL